MVNFAKDFKIVRFGASKRCPKNIEGYKENKIDSFALDCFVSNKNVCYIVFHADWCGHCQTMLEKLKGECKINNIIDTDSVLFVNCNERDPSLDKYLSNLIYKNKSGKLEAFPSIYTFKNNSLTDITHHAPQNMINVYKRELK